MGENELEEFTDINDLKNALKSQIDDNTNEVGNYKISSEDFENLNLDDLNPDDIDSFKNDLVDKFSEIKEEEQPEEEEEEEEVEVEEKEDEAEEEEEEEQKD